jgi:alpha-glucosidase
VDQQNDDPASFLNLTRRLLELRNDHPALRIGSCAVLKAADDILVLRRDLGSDSVLAVMNMSGHEVGWPEEAGPDGQEIESVNGAQFGHLPPYGAVMIWRFAE